MANCAAVIAYQFLGEQLKTVLLDTIDSNTINSQISITSQPLVNGDEISDHTFRQPKTMQISGTCSLNGSQVLTVEGSGTKLVNFEELFERLQRESVRCTIYKIDINDEGECKFKERQNMVLQNIQFVENINSIDFIFSFREVMLAEVIQYNVGTLDANLPEITEPDTTSFSKAILNNEKDSIFKAITEALDNNKLWTDEFKNMLVSNTSFTASAVALGIAVEVLIVALAISTTGIGTIIAAAVAVAAAAIWLVSTIVKAVTNTVKSREFKVQVFKDSQNEDENSAEIRRFTDFVESIYKEFEELDKYVNIYEISLDKPQEAIISIDNDYYYFTFEKNNVNNSYSLKVKDINEKLVGQAADLTCAKTSFIDCANVEPIFKTENNTMTYLIKTNNDEEAVLTNYAIMTTSIKPSDFNEIITKIIESKIFEGSQNIDTYLKGD